METVLITGANGLLGRKLAPLLAQQPERQVLATGRGWDRQGRTKQYVFYPANITNPQQIRALVQRYQPTVIVHAAAMTKVDDCQLYPARALRTNVEGTRYLVEAAEEIGAYFVYLSTDFIFDGSGEGLLTETDTPNPINHYGETKLAAERIVQDSSLRASIVRTVLVYGILKEMSRANFLTWVVNNLRHGQKLQVVQDQWRTPTLVEDLAEGCRLLVDQKPTGIFNIAGRDFMTPYDMAMQVAGAFELDQRLITPTNARKFKEAATRPLRTGLDITKAQTALGYQPHPLTEGLLTCRDQYETWMVA